MGRFGASGRVEPGLLHDVAHLQLVLGGVLGRRRERNRDDHAWRPFSLPCLIFGAAHTPGRPRASTTSMKRAVPNQTTRNSSQTATPVPNEKASASPVRLIAGTNASHVALATCGSP